MFAFFQAQERTASCDGQRRPRPVAHPGKVIIGHLWLSPSHFAPELDVPSNPRPGSVHTAVSLETMPISLT